MADPEITIPPAREPNTPRKFLNIARRYAKDHPDKLLFWLAVLAVTGAFVLGYALG